MCTSRVKPACLRVAVDLASLEMMSEFQRFFLWNRSDDFVTVSAMTSLMSLFRAKTLYCELLIDDSAGQINHRPVVFGVGP